MSIEKLLSLAWTVAANGDTIPTEGTYRHHESLDDLEASATNGCSFCQLVLDSIKGTVISSSYGEGFEFGRPIISHWAGKQPESNQPTMYLWAKTRQRCDVKVGIWSKQWRKGIPTSSLHNTLVFDVISVQIGDNKDEDRLPELEFELKLSLHRGSTRLGYFELDPDLGSQINFKIVRSWLGECLCNHAHFSTTFEPYLPTRVIDVGTSHSDYIKLRLCSQNEKGDYVALSHCWGGVINPLLTVSTMQMFQLGLAFCELPRNFQDAVKITRELGIRFLWIDSLCIIQDSKLDWEQESKKMGSVYKNSCVTIYALIAPDSRAGILNTDCSPPPDPPPAMLRIGDDPTETRTVTLTRGDSRQSESLSELLENSTFPERTGTLATRGWTLQEMALSPRQLYYGKKQVYWRCFNGCQSANGYLPGDDVVAYGYKSYFEISKILNWDVLQSRAARLPHVSFLLYYYYRLVMDYSGRRLSYSSDKLPAISGIMQGLQPLIGGDYLGGVWSKDFRRGLLWSSQNGMHYQDVPYRSPSWSWAVTDDMISFPGDWSMAQPFPETDIEIQLLEHSIVPRSKGNVYGELQAARITLRGHTMRFLRSVQVVGTFENHGLVDSIGTCFFDKRSHEESIMSASNPLFYAITGDGEKYLRSVLRDDRIVEGVLSSDEKWLKTYEISKNVGQSFDQSFDAEECLALIVHANEDDKDLYCLIIQAVHDAQYPCYRRVGTLWIGGNSVDITWCKSWKIETLVLV